MASTNKLSHLSGRVIPSFVRDDHPRFEMFIKSYFEYLERDLGEYDTVANLLLYRDIDETIDGFVESFRLERAESLPAGITPSLRTLIKHIREFYRTRGTETAYRFLFQSIFNSSIEFYYPKVDVLRASDATTKISDKAHLVDSDYWQDFSYQIKHNSTTSSFYQKLIKDLLHPAGMKLFNTLSIDNAEASLVLQRVITETLLIFEDVANLFTISIAESILEIKQFIFSRSTVDRDSSSWFSRNKEDLNLISRTGFKTLADFDNIPVNLLEGSESNAMGLLFKNDRLVDDLNYTVVNSDLTYAGAAAGDMLSLIYLPKQRLNYNDTFTSDGSFSNISVFGVAQNKNKLFMFVDGLKLNTAHYDFISDNVIVFPSAPANRQPTNGRNVSWNIVEHYSESFQMINSVNIYDVSKTMNVINRNIQVFVDGKFKIINSDYRLDFENNQIVFFDNYSASEDVEIVFMNIQHKEEFTIPEPESFTTSAGQLTYNITNFLGGVINRTQESYYITLNNKVLHLNVDFTFNGTDIVLAVDPGNGATLVFYIIRKAIESESHNRIHGTTSNVFYLDETINGNWRPQIPLELNVISTAVIPDMSLALLISIL